MTWRILRWTVGILAATLLAVAVIGSALAAKELTSASPQRVGAPPPELASVAETVQFPSTDGIALKGWFFRCDGATQVVVLLHGNGASRRQMEARAVLFHSHGYAVLAYDARGHGESAGDKTSAGYLETADLLGALRFVQDRGFHAIGLLGESQGGATIALAAKRLPSSVEWAVLESTYPTMRDALDTRLRMALHLPGWLAGFFLVPFAEHRLGIDIDDDAPIKQIGFLGCPVLVIGGDRDKHTLPTSTHALFDAAPSPKELWIVPGAAHVDLYGFAHESYAQALLDFISDPRGTAKDGAFRAGSVK